MAAELAHHRGFQTFAAARGTVRVAAIEAQNGHTSAWSNARAERVAARRGLGRTGGSDVHALDDLGRAYTQFPAGVSSEEALLEALRRGVTTAGGRSMGWAERAGLTARTAWRRARRGFRPI